MIRENKCKVSASLGELKRMKFVLKEKGLIVVFCCRVERKLQEGLVKFGSLEIHRRYIRGPPKLRPSTQGCQEPEALREGTT